MVWSDPLSLATTHGVSLPAGTEMFHFPAYPRNKRSVPAHDGRRVAPFGNPRIEAMLEAPRGLSHPQTSFIGTVCQGIHHTPFRAAHAPKNPNDSFKRQTTNHHTVKNDHKTIDLETRLIQKRRAWRNRDKANDETEFIALLASTIQFSNHHAPRPDPARGPQAHGVPPGASGKPHAPKTDAGGGPGTQKHTHTTPRKAPRTREANDLFHTSTPTPDRRRSPARGPHDGRRTGVLKNSVERR